MLSRRTLAPGVVFTRYYDPHGPLRYFVVDVDLARRSTIDVALAGSGSGFTKTSQMAAAHHALVAVNGDFGRWPIPRPTHAFAEDGFLRFTSSAPTGASVAVSADERHAYARQTDVQIRLRIPHVKKPFMVASWNSGDPRRDLLAGYTPPRSTVAAADACSARMRPTGKPVWVGKQVAVQRSYKVGTVVCQKDPLPLAGGAVLSARRGTKTSAALRAVAPGTIVKVAWTFGWRGVLDSIAGVPLLLKAGQRQVSTECKASFCARQPRTAVGFTNTGHLLLVVVDGRRSGWSVGTSLLELTRLMRSLGAVSAVNLDGGGSSTMVVQGKVVNRPTDTTGERAVTSAVLVLGGSDGGESGWSVRSTGAAATGAANALTDPGSTGGMADAVVSGALGPVAPGAVPAWMVLAARDYRARALG